MNFAQCVTILVGHTTDITGNTAMDAPEKIVNHKGKEMIDWEYVNKDELEELVLAGYMGLARRSQYSDLYLVRKVPDNANSQP